MYSAMNSRGKDLVPGFHENSWMSFFFTTWIIVGAFFMTNLFVGVVISAFNREQERLGKHFLLTESQKKWVETKILVLKVHPKIRMIEPTNSFRKLCYTIADSRVKYYIVFSSIMLNVIVLAIRWPNMSESAE